jgi:hypothetical protein
MPTDPGIPTINQLRVFLAVVDASTQNHSDDSPSRCPGESRDPLPPWAPAFAGEAGLSEVLGCLVKHMNDPEDYAQKTFVRV